MKRILSSLTAVLIVMASTLMTTVTTQAKFQKSDNRLFVDWLDLAVNPNPEIEFSAHAIVWTGGENLPVVYVITSNFKGKVEVLGVARCDKEFSVLKSHSNGMYDIRCVRQDVFGRKTTTTLKFGEKWRYKEIF